MNMNINDIRRLIERYMAAETTPEEQQVLTHYFATATDVPEDLKVYAELFHIVEKPLPLPTDEEMDTLAAEYSPLAAVLTPRQSRKRNLWHSIAAAAAIALIFFGVGYWTGNNNPQQTATQAQLSDNTPNTTLAKTPEMSRPQDKPLEEASSKRPQEKSDKAHIKKTKKESRKKNVLRPSTVLSETTLASTGTSQENLSLEDIYQMFDSFNKEQEELEKEFNKIAQEYEKDQ